MKSQIRVDLLEMEDPTFEAGATKTARARLTNPTAKQFTYTVELYLGVAKAATSGVSTVTIPANSYLDVNFTVTMPLVEGSYPVFLDVWSDSTLLKHYQATENVVVVISPAIEVGPITWV
jgi:hypothetical protein